MKPGEAMIRTLSSSKLKCRFAASYTWFRNLPLACECHILVPCRQQRVEREERGCVPAQRRAQSRLLSVSAEQERRCVA